MDRSARLTFALLFLFSFVVAELGCSGSAATATGFRTPASIILSPGSNISLDVGTTQVFTAIARDASNPPVTLTVPITYRSSNEAVVTVAINGLACAGTWNSLTSPQICTPGQFGVAEVTATSGGVSSPATTVYVHQHVDNVTIAPISMTNPCVSKGQTLDYQATAFSRGVDITSTVGQFTWTAGNTQIVSVSTTVTGLPLNEAQTTANIPGMTLISASVAGVNSLASTYITCPVADIKLAISDGTANSFIVPQSTPQKNVTATVIDSLGATITAAPLTWISSQPAVAPVGTTGGITFIAPGGATITAACTPPICNIGFSPSLPIYSLTPIHATVTPTGTAVAATVVASTTECATFDGCFSLIAPITTTINVVGVATSLPATPNSLMFGPAVTNSRAFLGTDLSLNGTRGIMAFDPTATAGTTVPLFPNQIGKILAVSTNANKVALSDTISSPNQVLIFDFAGGGSAHFSITGAVAADFSPDSQKAFIAAGNNVYVYSTMDALQTLPVPYTAIDVSALTDGSFVYVLGSSPSTVEAFRTCDDTSAASFTPPGNPVLMKATPDSSKVVLLSSPTTDVDLFDVTIPITPTGCDPIVTNGAVQSFNLGQGNFVPVQLLISSDSSKAYILTSNSPSVLVFNIATKTTASPIALTGGALALKAALTLDGNTLYVASSDLTVHVLDTVTGVDTQQLGFPVDPNTQQAGLCAGLTTDVNITTATQVGTDTTYTYSLTSGPALTVGASIVITNIIDAGNNGTFTITALGAGTFTVSNPAGITDSSQNGTGIVTVVCGPNLIGIKP